MANPTLKTYSPDRIKVIVGAASLTGYADGTFVNIEPLGDGTTSVAGADGEVARAMSLDRRHTITLTLLQTSSSNDVLAAMRLVDEVSGGGGAFPISITDLRGTTLFAGTAWIPNNAASAFSKTIESREWTIEAVGAYKVGGANL